MATNAIRGYNKYIQKTNIRSIITTNINAHFKTLIDYLRSGERWLDNTLNVYNYKTGYKGQKHIRINYS